jgi:Mn2+/Fe2+ NRAMP family transporter
MTALSARLGVALDGTLCDELARRVGRWAAVVAGVSLFLIAACFQFGNNLGVLAAVEPLVESAIGAAAAESDAGGAPSNTTTAIKILVIVALNGAIVVALFGFRHLYRPVELLMKTLVTLMVIGFAANLVLARPDLREVLGGLIPSLPTAAVSSTPPTDAGDEAAVVARPLDWTPVVALFATTFSVAGAFYQSYLVRKKGWTYAQLREGLIDSTVGISVLGMVTLMILVTAAAVLHGRADVGSLDSAADVARQLTPLFGTGATALSCLGIFAGAFSSFLVNAMIGGTVLSDGLGLGGDIDARWPKAFTVLALATGMLVAIFVVVTGRRPVNLIVFAQAMTVLGLPVLAASMLYLATRRDLTGARTVPGWLKLVAVVALVVVTLLAIRTLLGLIS